MGFYGINRNHNRCIYFSEDGTFNYYGGCSSDIAILPYPLFRRQGFGTFVLKNKTCYLYPSPLIDTAFLEFNLYEFIIPSDTILIQILSPYENSVKNGVWEVRDYYYELKIQYLNNEGIINDTFISTKFNVIKIPKNNFEKIENITLTILSEGKSTHCFQFLEKLSKTFNIQNKNSNQLIFSLNNFDYHYFYYNRFENDSIRYINKNKIEYKGNIYKKFYLDKYDLKFKTRMFILRLLNIPLKENPF